jgi:hypothetical protein
MAKLQETSAFTGRTAEAAFAAAEAALPEVGFEVWKRRPMAWLLLARATLPEGLVEASVACRPAAGAMVTVALSSATAPDGVLKAMADQVISAMATELGCGDSSVR